MAKAYRVLMVLLLISLVVIGLNISNQGISRLTTENRGQVIGMNFDNNDINLQVCSKEYNYSTDKIIDKERDVAAELKLAGENSIEYLSRIWRIIKAVI
ncbi:MAG: hypothetical protein PHC92_01345 [Syntrophomonadaceae bacterium]|nr:hypothetical protein [Syntrophomonadaceae bacterium]MDD3023028.1 hypothetical protein [Syntrophomonadaceae bacterium]